LIPYEGKWWAKVRFFSSGASLASELLTPLPRATKPRIPSLSSVLEIQYIGGYLIIFGMGTSELPSFGQL
jgi:hypothetical protein